jgi:hypothetical protein
MFVFIAAVLPPAKNRPYMGVGLITLIFGTISLFLAAVTGEQAAMVAGAITSLNPIIEAHATWAAPTPSGL